VLLHNLEDGEVILWYALGSREENQERIRQLEQDVFSIARELRCPVCRAESAADSNSQTSIEFRDIVREQLQDGQNREQILAYFQATYGDSILLDPPRRGLYLWVWGLPVAAGVSGLELLGYFLTRWRKNAAAPLAASPEDLERVKRELGRS
jgi:cytochrome c-type biogenesis protein CcmH